MTTIGQLVSKLFSEYEHQFHDEKLVAIATQVVLDELLRQRAVRSRHILAARSERTAA